MSNYTDEKAIGFIRRISNPGIERETATFLGKFENLIKIPQEILSLYGEKKLIHNLSFNPNLLSLEKKDFFLWGTKEIEINRKSLRSGDKSDIVYVHLSTSALSLSHFPYLNNELPGWIFEEPRRIFIYLKSVFPLLSKNIIIVLGHNFLELQAYRNPCEELLTTAAVNTQLMKEDEVEELPKFFNYLRNIFYRELVQTEFVQDLNVMH